MALFPTGFLKSLTLHSEPRYNVETMHPAEIPTHHPLEDFPVAPLVNTFTRQRFFAAIKDELLVHASKSEGMAVGNLAALGAFTFEEMMHIIPIILPGTRIDVKDNAIWAQPPAKPRSVEILSIDTWTLFAYNQINGSASLFDIALSLEEKGWVPERARAFTRGLFLTLVNAKVCVPETPPD
jgi:hypothetical protein